jgi:hypothetical protein
VWLLGETLHTETSQNWYYNQTLTHIHKKMKTILPRITVTLTMILITLLTQSSQTGLTVETVNLLNLYSTGLHKGPSGLWQIQPPHINNDPSPFGILTARQGRQAPSTSQLKRLDTRHNRHWSMQCKRIQGCVCSAKDTETRQTSSFENTTYGFVLPHIAWYITPNHISENQLTLIWKSRTHKCQ